MEEKKKRIRYKYPRKTPRKAPASTADRLKKFQWKPGQSGNPAGRGTKGDVSLVEALKKYLRQHPEEADAIIIALIKQGKVGNVVATKEMKEWTDGKATEKHQIEGELPITIVFVPAPEHLNAKQEDSPE